MAVFFNYFNCFNVRKMALNNKMSSIFLTLGLVALGKSQTGPCKDFTSNRCSIQLDGVFENVGGE